jgi:hypothetical protein
MSESETIPSPAPPVRKGRHILWYEAFGFTMIILLTWVNNLLSLPYHLFGASYHSDWRGSILETEVVILVWVIVHRLTRRVLTRLHYLERMLRMCAWCRKMNDGDEWVPMEEYFSRKFDSRTSHGMCPTCAASMRAEIEGKMSGERDIAGGS